MGGFKRSGLGCRHGRHGIQKYTEEQTISVQRLLPLAPPPHMGHKLWVRAVERRPAPAAPHARRALTEQVHTARKIGRQSEETALNRPLRRALA